jgi:hypothetical protein
LRFIHIPGSDQAENHHGRISPHLRDFPRRQSPNKTQEVATGERRPVDCVQVTHPKDEAMGIVKDSLLNLPDLEVMFAAQLVPDVPRDPQLGYRTGGSPHHPSFMILKVSNP